MKPLRIFISSVQKEFAEERMALRDYLLGDALLRRFFECFLFEEVPSADRRADAEQQQTEVPAYQVGGGPAGHPAEKEPEAMMAVMEFPQCIVLGGRPGMS